MLTSSLFKSTYKIKKSQYYVLKQQRTILPIIGGGGGGAGGGTPLLTTLDGPVKDLLGSLEFESLDVENSKRMSKTKCLF